MGPEGRGSGIAGRFLLALAVMLAGSFVAATIPSRFALHAAEERPDVSPKPAPKRPGQATSLDGERFFFGREVAPAKVACADCHLVSNPAVAPPDDLIRSGHNLFDAFGRGTWWNGRIMTDCGEAAEVCYKRFQGAEELEPKNRVGLVRYMKSQSAPVSNPWILLRVPRGQTDVGLGDAARGEALFRRACALCHPGGAAASEGRALRDSELTPSEIADLIRTGKGRMPFYQMDILGERDVADLAAHTHSFQPQQD
jgi:mono/diheme cytochrome c family protein